MNNGPRHIGFIMDGNRRFAKRLMLHPTKGHEWGAQKIWKVLEWCKKTGVVEATFYTFSTENFNRPKDEFDFLMNLFERECEKILSDSKIMEEGICLRFIGRTYMFPEKLQQLMAALTEKTKNNSTFTMNMAMAYGGRSELVDACKRIAEEVKQGNLDVNKIDEKTISTHLYISSEPDMIIRTGGERRTSNFLPFQSAYSEWFFLDKFWPEIEEEDVAACINEFNGRERRMGK